jgi:hypothetical protein
VLGKAWAARIPEGLAPVEGPPAARATHRFPLAGVVGPSYARKLMADAGSGDWEGVGRLGLLPAMAALFGLRKAWRAARR